MGSKFVIETRCGGEKICFLISKAKQNYVCTQIYHYLCETGTYDIVSCMKQGLMPLFPVWYRPLCGCLLWYRTLRHCFLCDTDHYVVVPSDKGHCAITSCGDRVLCHCFLCTTVLCTIVSWIRQSLVNISLQDRTLCRCFMRKTETCHCSSTRQDRHGLFCVHWFVVWCGSLFCWYWWNYWTLLFILCFRVLSSVLNSIIYYLIVDMNISLITEENIVLSVLLRFTDSDYPFGILKLLLI